MGAKDWLGAPLRAKLDVALLGLKRRVLAGSSPCTKLTLELLRDLVAASRFRGPAEMMDAVRSLGQELVGAASTELCIGNVVRRVLFIIREETARIASGDSSLSASSHRENRSRNNSQVDSLDGEEAAEPTEQQGNGLADSLGSRSLLGSIINASSSALSDKDAGLSVRRMHELRQAVLHSINELYEELDNLYVPICEQSPEYIHADECIFTIGHSVLVESFLKAAARKRRFYLIVAEGGPQLEGHKLASALSKVANISTTLVPDSSVYAIMSRVNKVVISPLAVLADGGMIAASGSEMVAIAAKDFSVPLVCLASTFMLSPVFAHNHAEVLSQLLSPALVMDYSTQFQADSVEILVAAYDYVAPHLIDAYITNNGTHQPSYVYRLLSEYYHPADSDFGFA